MLAFLLNRLHCIQKKLPDTKGWLTFFYLLTLSLEIAALDATVSSQKVAINKNFLLSINSYDDQDPGNIDLSAIENDFHLGNQETSSVINILNGKRSVKKTLNVTLQPKRTGQLRIPSLRLGKKATRPILIEVTEAIANPDTLYDDIIFVTANLNKNTSYVGESFIYTLKLYHRIDQESRLNSLQVENAEVEALEAKSYRENIKGNRYLVQEQRFLVTPKAAANITIQSPVIRGELYQNGRSFFRSNGVPFELEAKPVSILVEPLPNNVQPGTLVAEDLKISAEEIQPGTFSVGQPITRRIQVTAKGIKAEALPNLVLNEQSNFSVYEETPQFHNEKWLGGYAGTRTETFVVIPTQAGPLRLPAITIEWWNPKTKQLESSVLPSLTLEITAAPSGSADSFTPATNSLENNSNGGIAQGENAATKDFTEEEKQLKDKISFWKNLSFLTGSLALLFATLSIYLTTKSLTKPETNKKIPNKSLSGEEKMRVTGEQLLTACKSNDAKTARVVLSNYLRSRGNHQMNDSLSAEIQKLNRLIFKDPVSTQDANTEANGYTNNWNGTNLANAVQQDLSMLKSQQASESTLPPLYPASNG